MSFGDIESYVKKFPVDQYTFIKPEDVDYSDRVRLICKRYCPYYGEFWSCPPAVGKIETRKKLCLNYSDVLVFSTLTDLSGLTKPDKAFLQAEHEKLTGIISSYIIKNGYAAYILSSGHCALCPKCTFPKDFCRHPDGMYPCIESHGITVADLMRFCDMDYYMGVNFQLFFTLIYFKTAQVR